MNSINRQSKSKHYLIILKTLHGDPGEHITVVLRGTRGQTEKLPLGKSQSQQKAFKHNHTDLFVLVANNDVGKISQLEFHTNINSKFKQWKFNNIFIIDGIHIFRHMTLKQSVIVLNTNMSIVVNVTESLTESQESFYYAFIKTGYESCSKGCYPTLSLLGSNRQYTNINLKSSDSMQFSSLNHSSALEKSQLDIFQWQDHNIGNIERMRLQLYARNNEAKCQWPVEWIFVIHCGHFFTGRISLNRLVKVDRYIDIDLATTIPQTVTEHGDSLYPRKNYESDQLPFNIYNRQSNAKTEEIGRYYVIVRNVKGTDGNVYITFHGDLLTSSDEQHLLRCENYPEHPFGSKHTDLFHVKAPEVGRIESVSMRFDQSNKEQSVIFDRLFIVHNAIVYEFDVQRSSLNQEQSEQIYPSIKHLGSSHVNTCYYIAIQTGDQMLSDTNAYYKVLVIGTKGILGPKDLKSSLTNGNHPFQKACIDLFHIEDNDIGDPISITVTLEPGNTIPHTFNSTRCERLMLVKNGEYNSLWQSVGDMKIKESKTISLPIQQPKINKEPIKDLVISVEDLRIKQKSEEIIPSTIKFDPVNVSNIKKKESIDAKPNIVSPDGILLNDNGDYDGSIMNKIEDHQKRHIFASSLQEAEQNYRELRRLLKKLNGSIQKEKKAPTTSSQSTSSFKPKV